MLEIGFNRCNYDSCFYFKKFSNVIHIFLVLYVDDMLMACHDPSELSRLKKMLNAKFEINELGQAQKILCISIIRDKKHGSLKLV